MQNDGFLTKIPCSNLGESSEPYLKLCSKCRTWYMTVIVGILEEGRVSSDVENIWQREGLISYKWTSFSEKCFVREYGALVILLSSSFVNDWNVKRKGNKYIVYFFCEKLLFLYISCSFLIFFLEMKAFYLRGFARQKSDMDGQGGRKVSAYLTRRFNCLPYKYINYPIPVQLPAGISPKVCIWLEL